MYSVSDTQLLLTEFLPLTSNSPYDVIFEAKHERVLSHLVSLYAPWHLIIASFVYVPYLHEIFPWLIVPLFGVIVAYWQLWDPYLIVDDDGIWAKLEKESELWHDSGSKQLTL